MQFPSLSSSLWIIINNALVVVVIISIVLHHHCHIIIIRTPNFQGFIYDPTVGSSTTLRSGHQRPHGRVIYDPTVGSCTIPRSGHQRPHGRVFTVLLFLNSSRYYPLWTIELPFVVVAHNCPQRFENNYVQLFTRSCVVSPIAWSYVIQSKASVDVSATASVTSQLSKKPSICWLVCAKA